MGAGLVLSAGFPFVAAQTSARAGGRRMVVRADDIGMSKVCNIGTFEAIENGVVTAVHARIGGCENSSARM